MAVAKSELVSTDDSHKIDLMAISKNPFTGSRMLKGRLNGREVICGYGKGWWNDMADDGVWFYWD